MIEADQYWSDFIDQYCKIMMHALHEIDIELTDSDTSEYLNLYTISELVERLNHMDIEAALFNSGSHCSFREYFALKSKLAIYSHTTRQHQSISNQDLDNTIERLKPQLDEIETQENEAILLYQSKIEEITKLIAFAKIEAD